MTSYGRLDRLLPRNYDNVEEVKERICQGLLRDMEWKLATIARGKLDQVAFTDVYTTATDLILYKQWVPLRAIAVEALRKQSLVASPHHYFKTLKRFVLILGLHESAPDNKKSTPCLQADGGRLFYRNVAWRWRRLRRAVSLVCAANRRLKWWLAFAERSCHWESAYIATHVAPEFYALAG